MKKAFFIATLSFGLGGLSFYAHANDVQNDKDSIKLALNESKNDILQLPSADQFLDKQTKISPDDNINNGNKVIDELEDNAMTSDADTHYDEPQKINIKLREINGVLDSEYKTPLDLSPIKDDKKPDFSHCRNFYTNASVLVQNAGATLKTRGVTVNVEKGNANLRAIHIKGNYYVGFSKTKPKDSNIIKYDPFTGLFLLKSSSAKYSYTLMDMDDYAKNRDLVSTNGSKSVTGRLKNAQNGFLDYAILTAPTFENGVVGNICYQIYGLGIGNNKFIQKEYIDRFVNQKSIYYGDIGVRFALKDPDTATFEVQYSDPFFKNNQLKKGDVLVSINGVAPKNKKDLELLIANLEYNKNADVKIRRNGDIKNFSIKVDKMYGGYLMPDSFLERFNIVVDNNFVVKKSTFVKLGSVKNDKKDKAQMGDNLFGLGALQAGDRIIKFDNIDLTKYKVKTPEAKNAALKEVFTMLQNKRLQIVEIKKKQAAQAKIEDEKQHKKSDPNQIQLMDGASVMSENTNFATQQDFSSFNGEHEKNDNKNYKLLYERNQNITKIDKTTKADKDFEKGVRTLGNDLIKDKTQELVKELKEPTMVEMLVIRKNAKVIIPLFQ